MTNHHRRFSPRLILSEIQTRLLLKLCLQAYFSLLAAIVIGALLSAPFIVTRARSFMEMNFVVATIHGDDSALRSWALAQPDVIACQIQRDDTELHVRVEYQGLRQHPEIPDVISQMRVLGYEFRGMRGGSSGLISTLPELIKNALTLAVLLAGMQLAFGCIGLVGIHRANLSGHSLPPLFAGARWGDVVTGVLCALVLLVFGYLYGWGLEAVLGKAPPSPWDTANAMPSATKIIFLLFGGIGAPVAEEIFFRGYLFSKFKSAGFFWPGLILSSLLFGVVHFSDPYNIPAIFVYGILLAWSFHHSRSLVAPTLAHAINNCTAILLMVFA
ncbi:MAG: CPBP family intramembrane metalloprotease [Planctomycetes bacterium]|nr:CPBP family intramembrane metalloprotease [Planctomycetota bacterium]